MPRLFTGIELPEDIRDELLDLHQPLPSARWIEADDLHVTLRFFGDIEKGVARELSHLLAEIELDAFEVRLDTLGVFGGRDPRSLWAGVTPLGAIEPLARANERAARSAGLQPEQRKFVPHVTLARFRDTSPEVLARYLHHRGAYRSRPFYVTRFVLYASKPLVGGGPYVAEEIYRLAGGAWDEDDDPTLRA